MTFEGGAVSAPQPGRLRLSRFGKLVFASLWLTSYLWSQGLDNSGNSILNGKYYFRWVNFSDDRGAIRQATAAHGSILFDGRGTYRIDGQLTDSLNSAGSARAFTPSGTYVVSSNGMAEIQNPIVPGDTLYAGVGTAAIVGSSTERANHDLFVAIPAPTQALGNANLTGAFQTALFDFQRGATAGVRDAFFALRPDGNGRFSAFQPQGSAANGLPSSTSQNVSGATYSLNPDGSGSLTFPGAASDAALLAGSKVFYLSSDGDTIIGGSATGFDIIVGIHALAGAEANNAYRGLYYSASIQHDLRSVPYHQSLRGARNVQAGRTWYHERINAAPDAPANHYDGTDNVPLAPFDSTGLYANPNFYRVVGTGGRVFLESGRGNFYEIYLGVQARPTPAASRAIHPYGVVNGANLQPLTNPVAPGEVLSIFGSGFTATRQDATSMQLPLTLAGVQVRVNGRAAPLLSVGPNQINLIVPYATTEPYATVQVTVDGTPLNSVVSYARSTAPGVFTLPPGGAGDAAALHADYSVVSASRPAKPGETVLLFVTGLGVTDPAIADGAAAPLGPPFRLALPSANIAVFVGGLPATTSFAGLAPGFPGLYQINVEVPKNLAVVFPEGGSSIPVPLEVGTRDGATLASLSVEIPMGVRPFAEPNLAPVANPQNVSTTRNTARPITLTAGDADSPGGFSSYGAHSSAPHGTGGVNSSSALQGNLTFTIVSNPSHGTLSGTPPNVTYTPAANYVGPDSFQFTVRDRGNPDNCGAPGLDCMAPLSSAPATVSIAVLPVNAAPTATAQSVNTPANTPRAITLSGSDSETPAANLSYAVTSGPTHGVLSGTAPNLTYTPAANYAGPDAFQFTVTDRGNPDSCGAPGAACTGPLTSEAATVTIAVGPFNAAPVAHAQSITINGDPSAFISLSGTDAETPSGALRFTVTTPPANGILSGTPPFVTYVPNPQYFGSDKFEFTVTDRGAPDNCGAAGGSCSPALTSSPAAISIEIVAPPPPVQPRNTAPQAASQSVSTNINAAKPIALGGSDAETAAGLLTYTVTVNPAHGTLSGTAPNLTYTPTANFAGTDGFQFTVTDRGNPQGCGVTSLTCAAALTSEPAAVTITVQAVNTAPVANAQTVSTNEGAASAITLAGNDTETASGLLTYTVTVNPAHGTLSGTAPNLTYTPASGYFGPDSFQFKVTDRAIPDACSPAGAFCAPSRDSAAATVNITVVPVNTAPTATAQSVNATKNAGTAITLAGTDAETATGNLSFTVTINPAHGTLTGTGANRTYTPANNYIGPDSFQFTVTDRGKPDNCGAAGPACSATLTSAAATVSITVLAVNTPPTASPQSLTTNEGIALPVTLGATDAETSTANLTLTVTANPAHGTLTGTAPNLTYTPSAGYFGPDSIQFTVTDRGDPDNCGAPGLSCAAPLTSAAATINITVVPVNTAPTATAQSVNASQNAGTAITLAGTDTETAAGNLSFTVTVNPAHGTLTGTGTNRTYTPTNNYIGPDSFQFTVTDRGKPDNCGAAGPACSATLTSPAATVSITVLAVNTAPTAVGQSVTTNENVTTPIILTGTDAQTLPANLTYTVTVAPAHGSLIGTPPALSYVPVTGYFGADSFQFTVTDRGNPDNCGATGPSCAAALTSAPAVVLLTIAPVNTAPTATAQSVSVITDVAKTITLAGTDTETALADLTFTVTADPAHGTLSGTAPNLTYTPAAGYTGSDSFQFTVKDRGKPDNCGSPGVTCSTLLTSTAATVTITVAAINSAPTANSQILTTVEGAPLPVVLTATDLETASANLTFTVTTTPGHGTLTGTAPNLTYTPTAGYFGPDTIQFTVTDRGSPDNCGAPGPSCLAALTSAAATIAITVSPVNVAPTATAQSVTTDMNVAKATTLAGSDTETAAGSLSFTVTVNPAHGTLSGTAPNLTYTPTSGYFGADSFQFTTTDRGKPDNCGVASTNCAAARTSTAATVSITVVPVNSAPSATGQSITAIEATGRSIVLAGTDTETSPANLSFTVTVNPTHGTLTGTAPNLTYTPTAGYSGPDSLQFTVTDRGFPDNCGAPGTACAAAKTSSAATVAITVTPVNSAPVANAQSTTTAEDTAKAIVLTASDVETLAANLSYTISTPPAHGTLTGTAPNLTYTPASNYNGPDSFQFTVTDRGDPDNCGTPGTLCAAALTSTAATVSITVTIANDPPSAATQSVTTTEDTAKSITLAGTDQETAAGNLTYTISTAPAHGTLTGTAPNLTYTPALNYNGPDTFQFTVTDRGDPDNCGAPGPTCVAAVTSAPATVSITVTPINDGPTANGQTVSTNEDTGLPITLTGNDVETASANLVYTITQAPAHGTLSGGTGPSRTYTPASNYNGPDSFQFTVTDRGDPDNCGAVTATCAAALTSTAVTVSITVVPVNDAPTLGTQAYNAVANMKIVLGSGSLLTGAADPDVVDSGFTPVLSVTASTPATTPSGGVVVIAADGSFSFDPPPGVTGNVTFPYQVCDNGNPLPSQCTTGTVTVVVAGPVIWFVAPNLGSNGTGTLASPFNTLASATTAAGSNANHKIFVYHSTNPATAVSTASGTPVTLASGQWLVGQSTVAAGFDSFMGVSAPVTTIARPSINGAATTIQGTVTLNGNNNVVRGVTIQPPSASRGLVASTSSTGLTAGASSFPATFSDVLVSTSNAAAVDLAGGGSGDFIFKSVSTSGGGNGIILNNFNSSAGSFNVVGDGSNTAAGGNSSGGTISNMTGSDGATTGIGIYLNNTRNVTLRRMTINGTNQNYGIRGNLVNGFVLEYSTVGGTNGTAATLTTPENYGEGAIHFGNSTTNGVLGTVTFTNNSISGGRARNLSIVNTAAGTTTLTIKGNTFGAIQNFTDGNASLAVEARVNSGVIINTTLGGTNAGEPNTFTSSVGDAVNFTGQQNTTMDVVMQNNAISNNNPSNTVGGGSLTLATAGTMTFNVTGNTMRDANGSAVTLFKASALSGTPTMSGTFSGNTIGVSGVTDSGSKAGNGIFVSAAGTGTMSYTITNNVIHQIRGNAHIYADNTGGSYTANFTITGNTLDTQGAGWFAGIAITNGSPTSSDTINVCAKIGGSTAGEKNTLNVGGNLGVIVGASGAASGHTFNLPGYAGGANLTNVQNFLSGNNTGSFTTNAYVDAPATASAFTGSGSSCPTP
jgi:uncharacterized protein (TIGR03437 family)